MGVTPRVRRCGRVPAGRRCSRRRTSPRGADDRGVTHGAASAGPQLDLLREIADDRCEVRAPSLLLAEVAVRPSTSTCAPAGFTLSTISRAGKIGTEIRDAQAAAGGEHRRAQRADLVALAGRGRKEQSGRRLGARVQPEERAEDVPHRRGHQVFMRDAGPPAVPVVADLRQHRHQHVLEQFERRQDRRERLICWSMADGIVFLQRGGRARWYRAVSVAWERPPARRRGRRRRRDGAVPHR